MRFRDTYNGNEAMNINMNRARFDRQKERHEIIAGTCCAGRDKF